MSIRFSSRSTASPAFLCQLTSVASATDSGQLRDLDFDRIVAPFAFPASLRSARCKNHASRRDRPSFVRRERVLDQLPSAAAMCLRHVARPPATPKTGAARRRRAPASARMSAQQVVRGAGTTRPGSAALPGTRPLPSRSGSASISRLRTRSCGNGYSCSRRMIATSSILLLAAVRRAGRSRPCREQAMTRFTFFGVERRRSRRSPSGTARRRARRAATPPPCAAAGSSGVITISGLRNGRSICRRSRWKICAGVDGTQTCMLCSAQSCRKRSGRADECSGPCPS